MMAALKDNGKDALQSDKLPAVATVLSAFAILMPHKALAYLTYEASTSTTLRHDLERVTEENVNLLAEAETNRALTQEERNESRASEAKLRIDSARLTCE